MFRHATCFHLTSSNDQRLVPGMINSLRSKCMTSGYHHGRLITSWPESAYLICRIQERVAQSVMCLVTDASLTADPGAASLILARSHTFVEIDHEIISTVILLPSPESFKKGCCQLQGKECAQSTG